MEVQVDRMLDFEEPPEELPAVQEVANWDTEIENEWLKFREILPLSGLQQRVAIAAHVRNRRVQWVSMNQEKRDLYNLWKSHIFTQK
jgi:hypothetical protein